MPPTRTPALQGSYFYLTTNHHHELLASLLLPRLYTSDPCNLTTMKPTLLCILLSLFLFAATERPGYIQTSFNTIEPGSYSPESEQRLQTVLTSEFDEYISHMMELWSVKGIAITVVKPGSNPEYGAWGERSEEGDRMTVDVSSIVSIRSQHLIVTTTSRLCSISHHAQKRLCRLLWAS